MMIILICRLSKNFSLNLFRPHRCILSYSACIFLYSHFLIEYYNIFTALFSLVFFFSRFIQLWVLYTMFCCYIPFFYQIKAQTQLLFAKAPVYQWSKSRCFKKTFQISISHSLSFSLSRSLNKRHFMTYIRLTYNPFMIVHGFLFVIFVLLYLWTSLCTLTSHSEKKKY